MTFKRGDRVRCTREVYGTGFTKGKIYVVRSLGEYLFVEEDDFGSKTNGWSPKYFEHAEYEYTPSQEGDKEDDI